MSTVHVAESIKPKIHNEFPGILTNASFMSELNERFSDVAPGCFIYEEVTNTSKALSNRLKETYFPYDVIDARSFDDLSHLVSWLSHPSFRQYGIGIRRCLLLQILLRRQLQSIHFSEECTFFGCSWG